MYIHPVMYNMNNTAYSVHVHGSTYLYTTFTCSNFHQTVFFGMQERYEDLPCYY